MLPSHQLLRSWLERTIQAKAAQGHVTDGLDAELAGLPDSYDALDAFAQKLADLPLRGDWPYVEPDEWDDILAECDPSRPAEPICQVDLADAARRVEAGFLASCCGCILGKPLEVNPSLAELRAAAEAVGEWPLRNYVSEEMLDALGRRHGSWQDTTRGNIRYVASDDDLNYAVLGMLLMEGPGIAMTRDHIRDAWLWHLPARWTFGPERFTLLKAGIQSLGDLAESDYHRWVSTWNPMDEFCGALIRADAFGYACPGRPRLAAELAWRDASWTHRRTGIYGEMYVAAAIALALVMDDPLAVFETALKYVPRRSRFHEETAANLDCVAAAGDWLDGHERIHRRYDRKATHCRVYQEVGTLINTLRFAEDVGDGIGKQVAQGNDTDSFGCTGGAILGAFFGPGHLEDRWLAVFNDEIRTSLSCFFERSLRAVAERMGRLPAKIAGEIAASGH